MLKLWMNPLRPVEENLEVADGEIERLNVELTFLRAYKKACEQQEAVASQFQDDKGAWHGFMDQRHYENTIADGSWPIRKLYEHPDPESAEMRMRIDELLSALERFATWGRMQHKAQSKGGHATFDMMSLSDEIGLAEHTISRVKGGAA
jgi:hypothetical protein